MSWYWPFHRRKVTGANLAAQQARHETMIARLDRERVLMEQTAYAPPFELVNPWSQFYDGFKLLFPLFPARFDYRYSQNFIYLTQGQLDLFRSYSRYLYTTCPYAEGAVNCLADYTISTGFDYYCQPRKYARHVSKDLLALCNRHLEDVLNANNWWRLERELFIRPKRDGDAFLRFFAQDDGITKLRCVEPEQIRYPLKDADPEWSFGIRTDPDDRVEHLAYRIWYSQDEPDGETVDADQMLMIKANLDVNVKRGISDFFNVQDVLQDADKLLRAGRLGEAVRQSIAYVRQWSLANQTAILNLQAANTDYQLPKYNLPSGSGSSAQPLENVTSVQPGEVHDVPEGMEMQPGPVGNGQNLETNLNATLRAAAVKWRVPAWVLTGAVSENFAAALVAESPLVKAREYEQFVYVKEYTEVGRRILDIAARQGILPEDVLDQVEVCAEGKPIAARDLKAETEICAILRQHKLLSKRTWSAREDLDYDEEQANIESEPPDEPSETAAPGAAAAAAPGESSSPGAEYQRSTMRSRIAP